MIRGALFALIIVLNVSVSAASEVARFRVLRDVVNADLPPFTATIPAIGNGVRLSAGGGFEPVVFRTQFKTLGGSAYHIQAKPHDITGYNSWREGALDGAHVEILRIENGRFTSVRRALIPTGGHRSSGWSTEFGGRVLAASTTEVRVTWDGWNRLGVPYYFTVRAVDRHGHLSPHAEAVVVQAPAANPGKAQIPEKIEGIKVFDRASHLDAPQNLRAHMQLDRTAKLSWDPVLGAKGYVVYRSDVAPERHRGYGLDLAEVGAEIMPGDLVILRKKFFAPQRADVLSNRVWKDRQARRDFEQPLLSGFSGDADQAPWSLVKHPIDTPVESPGETFLKAEVSRNRPLTVGSYNYSGTSQTWYEVLDPQHDYTLEVWLRGNPKVSVDVQLPDRVQSLTLTQNWRKHRLHFRVPKLYTDSRPRRIGLLASGMGQIAVDNYQIFRSDAPYLALLPEDEARLKASGMGALRTHGFIKTSRHTYDLEQLTNAVSGSIGARGNTLPQTLAVIESANMDPWLQIEPHFSHDEWLGLAEFLAAPFDPSQDSPENKPWAAKRYMQGQTKPYTRVFQKIYFEIGNETWNRLFRPWVFLPMQDTVTGSNYSAAQVYGLYQAYVLSILQKSPYWKELSAVLSPVIGGWGRNDYGQEAAELSPRTPLMTIAEYNGGWDQDESVVSETSESFASVLGFAIQTVEQRATKLVAQAAKVARTRGSPLSVGTYEAGPGYQLSGLNGAKVTLDQQRAQERVMKSVAAGTATLDTFLMQARAGYRVQNYFTYGSGEYWKSHAPWFRGGQPYPSWQWLTVLNREGKGLGDLLAVETLEAPRRDLPPIARRHVRYNAPMVDVYPLLLGDELMLVVVSRLVPDIPQGMSGKADVMVNLPFSSANRVLKISMSGDLKTHNLIAPEAVIESDFIVSGSTLPTLTIQDLPPGKAQIFIFQGLRP